ncbi:MAG: exodeoxyribonuclease VII large subunit [Bdellovibrionales bacterium]|nr:exodeoxyribonuclease VII large subunit [Bdellovibrionales bacterium]
MNDRELPLFQSSLPDRTPAALSVSELTGKIKNSLEKDFFEVWVKGEVSNLKPASSGHLYFSLKDAGAALSAAAFGWGRKKNSFQLKDGMEVLCRGNISVYPPRGNYQLLVEAIEPVGAGSLQLAFDQLKEKLMKEGLFDAARKRPLPRYPSRIVVITSPQAAALRDVLTVLRRRAPFVDVILVPALVQGEDAPRKLIQAIRVANHHRLGEVILLTRGGGSIEDLWSFNHEDLARTIAESAIPVVSAVGHEVDFTISDFVSDLRAPTPSAGAEILTQHWVELRERTRQLHERLFMSLKRDLVLKKRILETLSARLKSPKDRLREQIQRLDEIESSLTRGMQLLVERKRMAVERLAGKLHALSPLQVLSRGYALVQRRGGGSAGVVVRSASSIQKGEELVLRFGDGSVDVVTQ